ncbi:MAG: LysM peptidoglycan-binding domain-containing protein [Phycisphaerales bacterium JB043]
MTREHKLALVLGFALVLVVGVLISDHFSGARLAQLEEVDDVASREEKLLAPSKPLPDERQKMAILAAEAQETPDINPEPQAGSDALASALDAQQGHSTLESIQEYARSHGLEFNQIKPAAQLTDEPSASKPIEAVAIEVQKGDSLWKLTQRATGDGNLYKKVAAFNASRLPNLDVVRPGMTLLIPSADILKSTSSERLTQLGQDAIAVASQTPSTTTHADNTKGASTYTVKPGDVLSVICQRELGTVKRMNDVLALNHDVLDSPHALRVGMVIKLPEVN